MIRAPFPLDVPRVAHPASILGAIPQPRFKLPGWRPAFGRHELVRHKPPSWDGVGLLQQIGPKPDMCVLVKRYVGVGDGGLDGDFEAECIVVHAGPMVSRRGWHAGRLVIVCGLPGSGKTTLATRLEGEHGALRFCPGEWMAALGIDLFDEQTRDGVEQLQWRFAQRLLELGQVVVIEWAHGGVPSGIHYERAHARRVRP